MSRIWKLPIVIPEWVEVKIQDRKVDVKWPKGELSRELAQGVKISQKDNTLIVEIDSDEIKNLWGLSRTLVANMIEWVVSGFEKKLLILWVGYNAKVQGQQLVLNLGYSHPINFDIPSGISMAMEKDPKWNEVIAISWTDKQLVGQIAAKVRWFRAPEVYKGKWIRYIDEVIKLKAGKTAKK